MIRENPDKHCPYISIILISLNSKATIERAINSVLDLDYPNFEFIICDGDSNDGTLHILQNYRNFIDTLLIEKDKGVYHAMNKAIEVAKGDFLFFMGADDIIINSWSKLSGKLRSQNTIYYCNVYFPITNRVYSGRFSKLKLLTKNICHQSIFYPRSVFLKYKFSTKYCVLADYHLNLLLKCDKEFRFEYINLLVAVFSEKGMSSRQKDEEFLKDRLEIIRHNFSFPFYLYCFIGFALKRWLRKEV